MNEPWSERVEDFISKSTRYGVFEWIGQEGNKRSAQTTCYRLAIRFPVLLWRYRESEIMAALPLQESLSSKAMSQWAKGAFERNIKPSWPPDSKLFVGDPYLDSLEEIADLYNYVTMGYEKNQITKSSHENLIVEINALYNNVRKSFEVDNVKSI